MKDYYYILGINEKSTKDEIKKAYHKLSHKFHPDKNEGDKFFEERFKDIKEAYETLIDPIKRKYFDLNYYSYHSNKESNNSKEEQKEEGPLIVDFSVDREYIYENETVTLTWNVLNSDKIEIQKIATNLGSVGLKSVKVKNLKDKEFIDVKLIASNSKLGLKTIKSVRIHIMLFNDIKDKSKGPQNHNETDKIFQTEKPNSQTNKHSNFDKDGKRSRLFFITLSILLIPLILYFCSTIYNKYSLEQSFNKETQLLAQEKYLLQYSIPSLGILFKEVETKYINGNVYLKFKIASTLSDKNIQNIIASKLRENKYSFDFNFKDKSDFVLEQHRFYITDLTSYGDPDGKIVGFYTNGNFEFDREKYKHFTSYDITYNGAGIDISEIKKEEDEKEYGKPIVDMNFLGRIHLVPMIVKDSFSLNDRKIYYFKIDFPYTEDIGGNFNLRNLRPEEFTQYKLTLTDDFVDKCNFSLLKLDFNGDKINDFCTVLLNKITNKCGYYLFLSESKAIFKIVLLEDADYNQQLSVDLASIPNIKPEIQVNISKVANLIEFDNTDREPLKIPFNGLCFNEYGGDAVWVYYYNSNDNSIRVLNTGQ